MASETDMDWLGIALGGLMMLVGLYRIRSAARFDAAEAEHRDRRIGSLRRYSARWGAWDGRSSGLLLVLVGAGIIALRVIL